MIADLPVLLACAGVGLLAGILYLAGLWWTVRRLGRSRRPAGWAAASYGVRTVALLAVFYAVSGGRWERLLACLAGFTLARLLLLVGMGPKRQG